MHAVLEPVLAVGMVEQAAQDDRPAGTATGGRAKSVCEQRAVSRQRVDVRRADRAVAVAAEVEAQVVGDYDDDVFGPGPGAGERKQESGGEE